MINYDSDENCVLKCVVEKWVDSTLVESILMMMKKERLKRVLFIIYLMHYYFKFRISNTLFIESVDVYIQLIHYY